jgi:hypothetical protein
MKKYRWIISKYLVGGLESWIFIWECHYSNCLSYFSEGLAPTRIGYQFHICKITSTFVIEIPLKVVYVTDFSSKIVANDCSIFLRGYDIYEIHYNTLPALCVCANAQYFWKTSDKQR